jgi:hypothetical protein
MTAPTTPWITPEAVQSLRPDVHVFPPEDLLQDALIIRATTKVGVVSGDQPVVRCPLSMLTTWSLCRKVPKSTLRQ